MRFQEEDESALRENDILIFTMKFKSGIESAKHTAIYLGLWHCQSHESRNFQGNFFKTQLKIENKI